MQIMQLYEQTIAKPYRGDLFQNIAKLSEEIMQLGEDNGQVMELEREEVVVYNLKEFKKLAGVIEDHIRFADAFLRGLRDRNVRMEVELSNKNLMQLRMKIISDWEAHQDEI